MIERGITIPSIIKTTEYEYKWRPRGVEPGHYMHLVKPTDSDKLV